MFKKSKNFIIVSLLSATLGCSSATKNNKESLVEREPSSADAFDQLLDSFELLPHEAWKGGDKETEKKNFILDKEKVVKASEKLMKIREETSLPNEKSESKANYMGRVFHDKSHGCLTATFKVRPNSKNQQIQTGLFKEAGEYPMIMRFSNGVGFSEHDLAPDVRGLALKIFYDSKNPSKFVDFLMTNSTNPLGRDHQQFVNFMSANIHTSFPLKFNDITTLTFFINDNLTQAKIDPNHHEIPYLKHFLRSVTSPIVNPLKERYWSGHTYQMDNSHFKFSVKSKAWNDADQKEYDERHAKIKDEGTFKSAWELTKEKLSYKDDDSNRNARRAAIKRVFYNPKNEKGDNEFSQEEQNNLLNMVFEIQTYQDDINTPVENTLVEWKEKISPFTEVAQIVIDPDQGFDNPGRDLECNQLRFTPGHFHPDHRPTGNMGRGRLFSYLASQISRKAIDDSNVNSSLVENWKQGNYTSLQNNSSN